MLLELLFLSALEICGGVVFDNIVWRCQRTALVPHEEDGSDELYSNAVRT